MKSIRTLFMVLATLLALAGGAWAQMMRGGMGMRMPQIPGMFKASVGDGAEYMITTKENTLDMEVALVGKETVEGQEGYWQEMRMKSGMGAGMIQKMLMVSGGANPGVKRMIMQAPGQEPMEMPMGMMGGMMQQHMQGQEPSARSAGDIGEMVGTEMITVPAGTFLCDHYKTKGENSGDAWISAKVFPYGLVKLSSKDTTMVLQKTLSNQASQIKGEPRKIEMPHF